MPDIELLIIAKGENQQLVRDLVDNFNRRINNKQRAIAHQAIPKLKAQSCLEFTGYSEKVEYVGNKE